MFTKVRIRSKKLLPLLLAAGLMLQTFVPVFALASDVTAGVSSDTLDFSYGPTAQDVNTGTEYHYVENSKAKAVIGTTVGANNRVGALVKNTPVDFVLKDSVYRETLDWTEFLLSDTMHANWQTSATTQNSFNLDTVEVKDGDKVVATGVSQANPNLATQMTYTLLPESPIMKITIHLENNGTNNYEGFLNYQMDPDEGQQLAYSPGIGWSEVSGGNPAKLFTNKEWTGNYLYDGDKKPESTVPAHGIAWHETEPTGINAQGYIAGVWFDASVNAGSSRDIVVYHITDYTLGAEGYSAIEGWANAIPDIQDGTLNLAKINGTVYDEDGTIVSGVKVIARNIEAQAVNVAVTDDQGNYSMLLPSGTYTLTGNRMAYSDSSNSVEVDNIQEPYQVNLYMEAITVAAGTGKKLPGSDSEGSATDIVMENQKMAMTISKTFDDPQLPGATVGKPIDLAAQGTPDVLDWINLPYVSQTQPATNQAWNILTVKNQNVDIVANDGSQAIVRATGTALDTIPFNVVTTYTMKPDENWVYAVSEITNPSDQPQTVWIGDSMNIDTGRISYVPGTGIITSESLGNFEPSMPWIAAYGNESEAYGLIYEGDFEGFTAIGTSAWIGSQKQVTIPAGESYHLKRYISSPSTVGFENKYEAVSDVYEEILKRRTGIDSSFQLTPGGIVQSGDQVSAQLSVTNGSDQPLDGVTANLNLSANLSTNEDLQQSLGTIAPNSTVTIEWPLDTLDGGRGTTVVDVTYQDSVISTQTKRIFVEGAGWYSGDNHSHSKWSDGSGTINDNFTSARNKGLDWLTATDHNNIGQQVDVALENRDDFVALWGEEISTPGGHSLAYNISELIDWNQPAQQYIDDTRASNNNQGLHYIAHPFYPGLEWDNWDIENITGLEVWNGFYPPMHPVNMKAEEKWDELNKQGKHVYGISNSDAHNPGKVGANFIRGYMPELGKENILKVLGNGSYYGTNGPHVTFNINDKMMGEDLGVSETGENVNLNFSGYSEMGVTKVRLIKNGDVLQEWTPNENDITEQLSVQAVPGDFFRMELEGNNGQYAFTNPIFINQMVSEDATLKQLTLSEGDLSPSFEPSVTDYTANVANTVNSITVTAAVYDVKSSLVVSANGIPVSVTNNVYGPIDLNVGSNTISFEVKAENQTKATYQVVVNRAAVISQPGDGGNSAPPNAGVVVNAEKGGMVTLNGAKIVIPAGASNSDISITVDKVINTAGLFTDDALKLVGNVYEIRKDKDGVFTKNVSITLPFNGAEVDEATSTVSIYWFNETEKKWIPLGNPQVDTGQGVVTGTVNHFTKFAVLTTDKLVELSDIQGHWAENSIRELVGAGVIGGYPNGTFAPNRSVSRAEFAVMVVKAFGLEDRSGETFADIAGHWARTSIETALAHKIITGYNVNTFGPDDLISREQMAAMIVRAAKLPEGTKPMMFTDSSMISEWAKSAVAAAVEHSLITGYENVTFRPKVNATRAEAVTVILKAIKE